MGERIIAYLGDTIYLAGPQIGKEKILKSGVKDEALVAAATQYQNAEMAALQGAGFPDDQVKFNLVKDWMESAGYTSTGSKVNNPGNIMYGKHNINATRGPYLSKNKTYLAAYKNLAGYAGDLKRVLSLSPGRPYDAKGYPDLTDFVHRCKLNKYFGDESEASYLKKMKGAQQRLKILQSIQEDTHQDINTAPGTAGDKFTDWWNGLTTIEKVGIGVAAFTGIVVLTKR